MCDDDTPLDWEEAGAGLETELSDRSMSVDLFRTGAAGLGEDRLGPTASRWAKRDAAAAAMLAEGGRLAGFFASGRGAQVDRATATRAEAAEAEAGPSGETTPPTCSRDGRPGRANPPVLADASVMAIWRVVGEARGVVEKVVLAYGVPAVARARPLGRVDTI